MRTWIHIVSGLLAIGIAVSGSPAQTQPAATAATTGTSAKSVAYRYRLLGVYDERSGDPVEGVEVQDILTGAKSSTSSTGTVSLLFLPDGGSMVRLKKIGYGVQTMTVAISPADTAPITVLLARVTELPTVLVKDSAKAHISAGMTTFENHRTQGFGQFIPEDEMRKNDDHTLADLLPAKFSGMMIQPGQWSQTWLVSSRKGCSGRALKYCTNPSCYVTVYTNGIKTYDYSIAKGYPTDFARINVSDYAAVEFYPGGGMLPEGVTPTNSDCGVLMLWTREK